MTTTAEWILDRVRASEWSRLPERFAPAVLVDLNVPQWRVQLQGRETAGQAIREQLGALPNVRTTWMRSAVAGDTVMLEYEMRWDGPDGEYLSRAAAAVRVEGEELVEYTEYCTGNWSPDDIARNRAEAPIVRW
jgi:hypothetical protein